MFDVAELELMPDLRCWLPDWAEITSYLLTTQKSNAAHLLRTMDALQCPVIQPRCGVGGHPEMIELLRHLENEGQPELLSVTIDSHTRLKQFSAAERTLMDNPDHLNGYPLVAHGWRRGRELNESVAAPLEVRHGSPDPRELFAFALASGITSFEGAGISYNLPYSKNVSLSVSLAAWRQVDSLCGELARMGVIVEREMFGSLTAVLVPPSISLAIGVLEALLAAEQGVRCVTISYPQGGEIYQDIAALRAIRELARRYLPAEVAAYPVLHEFMGVFPRERHKAEELIFYGALVGRLGAASKIINKTYQEAHGIPDATANASGVSTTRMALSTLLSFIALDEDRIHEEQSWIECEVAEIIEPIVNAQNLPAAISLAFECGTLDIPFSASAYAKSDIIPMRDGRGSIRYLSSGALPFSHSTVSRNVRLLDTRHTAGERPWLSRVAADINYFS